MRIAGWLSFVVCFVILAVFSNGCDNAAPTPPSPPEIPAPPAPVFRYKEPGNVPLLNQPFDFAGAVSGAIPQLSLSNKVRAGILVDLTTHRVLWEKDAQNAHPIASLTKLLTFFVIMEELEKAPKPDFDSLVTVSIDSTKAAPVKINLKPGEKVRLRDLISAMMLGSANDAAFQLAEYFGDGSSRVFVGKMNDKAQEIGMKSSHFVNPNGLPIYGKTADAPLMNTASPLDLIVLADHAAQYPQIQAWTSSRSRDYRSGSSAQRTLNNSNRLLGSIAGANGIKTGYTNAAGHCLLFSAERNGHYLVGVALGFNNRNELFNFSRQVLEWGFAKVQNR